MPAHGAHGQAGRNRSARRNCGGAGDPGFSRGTPKSSAGTGGTRVHRSVEVISNSQQGVRMKRILLLALFCLAAATAFSQNQGQTVQEKLGHPATAKLLIIHADDLGMSHSVNRATFEALEKGWVTSSSILVPCPWFPEVARWAQAHPDADLGIHLALNSEWTSFRWRPLSAAGEVPSLVDADGYFPLVETTVGAQAKPAEVERELRAQVDRARAAGIRLSHLDSHMGALFQ